MTGAIAARGFLLRGDTVRPWDPPFSVDGDGTVHIAGAVDVLFAGVPAGLVGSRGRRGAPRDAPHRPE